ncbi:pitrilysin family protein [Methyloligella sp. 2.7D]|uniref:M16 family metallopeptidase n=1 Tax=unclassified Methyloligella TaxID=2625955 RepID=UPI00157DB054|nr:pitrilysin family protein [Methyloligella sp. GL2]QKP78353.1 insulinase family protein [Methyloligella sp. GL2]
MQKPSPKISEFQLDNGLQVVVVPDHRAPVATQILWYKVGGADDPKGASGVAHFLEHLMFKGTEEIPPGQFAKIVARNGGEDNAFTSHDVTAYFQRVAKDRLPKVMAMEADRMANLRLSEESALTERDVILEERRSRVDNDPGSILQEKVMAALFETHPYGIPIIGWENEIAKLTRDDALAFYKRFYAPNNAILVVAGDVEPEEVRRLAEETYGKHAPNPELGLRKRTPEAPHAKGETIRLADPRAGRITVQRHYRVPSYNSATKPGEAEALDLMMRVVSARTAGKLYRRLVVEEKIAASAGGWYADTGLDSGRLALYGVAAENVTAEQLDDALSRFIADLKRDGVTQAELDRARNAYLAQFIYAADSHQSLARHYGWRMATGMTLEQIEAWPDRLKKVTPEEIADVARTYLTDENSVTGILEPAAQSLAA